MDPFRDELASAHAKIAQLEEEIRLLHARPQTSSSAPIILLLLAVIGVIAVFIGLGAVLVMTRVH